MSTETEKKLLEIIEYFRKAAGEEELRSKAQIMCTAYADGVSRALHEIRKEQDHESRRQILSNRQSDEADNVERKG